jgi:hypothetical protein
MNRILAIALSSSVIGTISLQASTYTFKNTSNYDVEVHFKFFDSNEPIEKITVPAKGNDNKPGVASRSFGGWRTGLCIDTKNALRARALPDGKLHLPIVKAIKNALESNPLALCFDRTFTITETKDHVLVFVYE